VIEQNDLVVHFARFAGALRSRGVQVGTSDEVDATSALTLIDLADRGEIRRALLSTLRIRPRDREAFDDIFNRLWDVADPGGTAPPPETPRTAGPVVGRPWRADSTATIDKDARPARSAETATIGYSREAALRKKPIEECSPEELADMEALLAHWAPRWRARRSRRLAPVKGRGKPDIRRSFRKALATGGEMLSLAHRNRALDEPRLVVLCDTSGSMDVHARFLLAFALALRKVAPRTEVFAFNTSLTRLTPWLSPGKIGPTLDRLAVGVPGWSGGTRIGESLWEFVATYPGLIGARTIIVIVSDGLDRGDTTLVTDAMRALSVKSRRIVWLNPLSGDPRYEPSAHAMRAAMPFIDRFGPAHTLESLERILPDLAA
jgi:uncharacterized protein with von Willebrand factor type A (vWA) domain